MNYVIDQMSNNRHIDIPNNLLSFYKITPNMSIFQNVLFQLLPIHPLIEKSYKLQPNDYKFHIPKRKSSNRTYQTFVSCWLLQSWHLYCTKETLIPKIIFSFSHIPILFTLIQNIFWTCLLSHVYFLSSSSYHSLDYSECHSVNFVKCFLTWN